MKNLPFYIVDVFAEEKYAGNQLAVVRHAKMLDDIELQKIARETHYSETTFILSDKKRNGGYDVRIFSPEKELPFAGHPTLGTAYVIGREIAETGVNSIVLNLKVGQIQVTFVRRGKDGEVLWMKQIQPTFGRSFDANAIATVLGVEVEAVNNRFPAQEVSTGVPFIIVPLRSLAALKRARIVREKYSELIENAQAKAILIFCPETYSRGNDLSVRVFADYYGIPEDPATGSANGCLAGYLVRHDYFGKKHIDIRVEQGYEIGRPSLLLLRAEQKNGEISVHVGGKVVMVAKGELI